jgi:hypothetical protein
MERLTCDYCGLPIGEPPEPAAGGTAFCCSGCAMASRLGIEGDQFPVTPQLIFDLLFGFGVFNQFLLVLFAAARRSDGRAEAAALCVAISAGLGVTLYLAALGWQWRGRWLRASDVWLYALLAAPVLGGAAVAVCLKRGDAALVSAVVNLALAGWLGRGFLRRALAKRSRT